MGAAGKKLVSVRTPNVPGYSGRVDGVKYEAVKDVLLAVLPSRAPGMTQEEMMRAARPRLPQNLFLGGARSGW